MNQRRTQRVVEKLLWFSLFLGSFLFFAWVSWQLHRPIDFGYALWYRVLAIDEAIATYAPRNRFKPRFADTNHTERARLFGEIVVGIHGGGVGLERLRYHDPAGRELGVLLRAEEVAHLRDVAGLIEDFDRFALLSLALSALSALALRRRRATWPGMRRLAKNLAIGVLGVSLTIVLLGPTRVFYWFHEQLFPPGSQWFFYYEESLMSTLMNAPTLFGGIALSLVVLCFSLCLAALPLLKRWFERGGA